MDINDKKVKNLQKKVDDLGFWRLLWYFPIKLVIVLAALATIIAFPFNLVAGFICLGITVGSLVINGVNYAIYDKVDSVFYEKIRKTNQKIDALKQKLAKYEEFKLNNDLKEDKAFDTAVEIVNSEKSKQEKFSIAENASYLRENFNKISEEINNTF